MEVLRMQKKSDPVIAFACAAVLVATGSALWGQSPGLAGYRLDRAARQIATDTEQLWGRWLFPVGTVEISAAGVRPRPWTMDVNAADRIVDFLRERPPDRLAGKAPEEISLLDAVEAGSNREDVLNILDPDPATYWEPAPLPEGADIPSRWWFTLDLGRVVILDRIVLRFVDEVLGDPFLLFDVLTSDGQKPVSAIQGESLEFLPVLQLLAPNTTQRVFEIDFSDVPKDARTLVARYVQVVVRGSRQGRGHEIDAGKYERLPEEDRGAVEYVKRLSDGQLLVVPEENYRRLPDQRQGPIRYYRRERPRLAELEIWEEGEDLARRLLDRGGSITTHPASSSPATHMFDGDVLTTYKLLSRSSGVEIILLSDRKMVADLGSFFWINSLQFIMNLRGRLSGFTFGNFQLDFSDGSRHVDGSPEWVTGKRIEQRIFGQNKSARNLDDLHRSGVQAERHTFAAPILARYFRLAYEIDENWVETGWPGSEFPIAELRMFSEGFQPRVSVESPMIDPGGTRTLTSIEWEADTPPGTSVFLETRTSSSAFVDSLYFNALGDPVTKEAYEKLKDPGKFIPLKSTKGEIVTERIMGSDASAWSEPYRESGSRISSPSPRAFVQIRATLLSDTPEAAATLRSVHLNYAEPLADRFLGEVTPARVESLAVVQPFSLYMRPEFGRRNPGFDGILLTAPDGMSLEGLTRVLAGAEQDLIQGGDLSQFVITDAVQLDTADDSLLVTFPLIEPDADIEILRLDFAGRLFSIGGRVQAFARFAGNGDGEPVWQQVDGGNAADGVDSNRLLVVGVQQHRQLMTAFDLPPAFTPNGDGVNDEAVLRFAVVLVGTGRAVEVTVFDLSGRLVRTLRPPGEVGAGKYEMKWDGTDEAGQRVPPGVYALRFHVEADDEGADLDERDIVRTVAVAY